MKNECENHINDIDGFCEWVTNDKKFSQTFSECNICKNGIASDPVEVQEV